MSIEGFRITPLLILAEACYLYPLYQLAVSLLSWPPVSPLLFFLVVALLLIINYQLSGNRLIILLLANAGLIAASLLILTLFKPMGAAEVALAAAALAWLVFRSLRLFMSSAIDVFVHFDVSLLVIFIAVTLYSVLQASGGYGWLMLSFLLSIFSVSVYAGAGQGRAAWLGGLLASVVLVPLFMTAQYFLPALFGPAQILYSLGTPVVLTFRDIIGRLFSGYVTHFAKQRSSPESQLAQDTNQVTPGYSTEVSPVYEAVIKVISILVIAFIIILVIAFLIYLLRLFWIWLLRRQGRPVSRTLAARQKLSWKSLFGDIPVLIAQLKIWLLPWLPVHLDIAGAYRALLKWGGFRHCPKEAHETPYEYLSRLTVLYPRQEQELHTLTDYYVMYKYSKDPIQYPPAELKANLRRLFFPGRFARTTRS